MKRNLYAGIDVGSSSVRVGLLDDNGVLIDTYSEPITYYVNKENPSFVTQSSDEVWNATLKCLGILKNSIKESGYELVSVGCCATCSMVVMRNTTDGLVPYPVNYASDDENQNIVFWMDRRAQEQADFINNKLKHDKVLDKQGGAFIAEMGIPKVKYLIEHIPKEDIDDIVFFDLHDFISYKLGGSKTNNNFEINISNTKSQIALDGELKGWSSRFFKLIGLEQLAKDNFKAIGRVERNSNYTGFLGVPLAGTKIGKHENCTIGHGVIDSYGSWLASSGKSIEGTLTMVAGTSTCFIIGHTSNETVPGIWGPFEGIFSEYLVSTAGQSATGLLFQRLFESHPAFTQIQNHTGDDVFEIIEDKIKTIELETGKSIHFLTKNMHLYGDLLGNRTPYCDSGMRGVFYGESADTSLNDFIM
ncbi:hypothetical protein WICMUC_000520 [Wickerhamomyces mucosus]|uniref:Carbohydrate kinase FGGY N-terminal domain-containing protein n=1 Tax=Wickerhamomyces mucosus TaxID=1378264 RepID=A0A9P8TIJ8_9ASCO|nr:hypothetical protein WICMUC_000520 [Wickerhamomyces mucosus]